MEPRERDPRTSAATAAFDLNAAVAAKRAELTRVGLGSPDLTELEDHLRAQHAELMSVGLSADEAWLVAEQRLGPPRVIGREFGTLESRLPAPILWMAIGFLLLRTTQSIVMFAAMYVGRSPLPWVSAATLLVGTAALFWFLARIGNACMARPGRTVAILLLVMFGQAILGAVAKREFTPEEYGFARSGPAIWAYGAVHLGFWCLLLCAVLRPLVSHRWRHRGANA